MATDAIMSIIDLLIKNHLQKANKDVKILSSFSYMDTVSTKSLIFGAIFCALTMTLVPLAVSGHFSIFIFHFIVEKEEKTRFMMQVHGMGLKFYLMVSYVMFFIGSFTSCMFLWLVGHFVLELPVFTLTSSIVIALVFALWAHSQVSLALFIQNFPLSIKITSSRIISLRIYLLDILSCRINICELDFHGAYSASFILSFDSSNDVYKGDK
jgi:hypothetical protein